MNTYSDPANVTFGTPNASPSNFFSQQSQQENSTGQVKNNKPIKTFSTKIFEFLNSKTGTLLKGAIGMAIGFAFKDFVASIITNLLQPLIIQLILMTNLNTLFGMQPLIESQNNTIHIVAFINSLFTFVTVVITVYYLNFYIAKVE
jgi:large-conductance mechanosensitive channel